MYADLYKDPSSSSSTNFPRPLIPSQTMLYPRLQSKVQLALLEMLLIFKILGFLINFDTNKGPPFLQDAVVS
jgi:hypothetical protein